MGSLRSSASNVTSPLSPTASLQPTWNGYVSDTREALVLFEATIGGQLNRVVRRPHDRERSSLISCGSVFIYEESASGIKRWTDGVPWSPSRILNNFLIYRELEKPFPPGEKKRAAKKIKGGSSRPGEPYPRSDASNDTSPPTPTSSTPSVKFESSTDRDTERSLVGSLTDSYAFKENGLVKKTMSVVVEGVSYHLVSYYNPDNVKQGLLPRPSDSPILSRIRPRTELLHRQNFRAPLDDVEDVSPIGAYPGSRDAYAPGPSYMPAPGYVSSPTYGAPMHQYQMHMQQLPQMYQHDQRGYPQHSSPPQHQAYYPSPSTHSQLPPPPMYGGYTPYQDQRQQYLPQEHYGGIPTTSAWPTTSPGS